MLRLLRSVDDLLRGRFTTAESLAGGKIDVPVPRLAACGVLLGAIYGACMGLFSVLRGADDAWKQILADVVKVPALFLLTLIVTFPSLYVFAALNGSRLKFRDSVRLMLIAIGIDLAVLASFGPVTAFFTLSTESYPFMVLLNVVFFAIAGFVGLAMLRKALSIVFARPAEHATSAQDGDSSKRVFTIWTIVYAIVGAQMGWILRPFIGTPARPFELFRDRQSNFFAAVIEAWRQLLHP